MIPHIVLGVILGFPSGSCDYLGVSNRWEYFQKKSTYKGTVKLWDQYTIPELRMLGEDYSKILQTMRLSSGVPTDGHICWQRIRETKAELSQKLKMRFAMALYLTHTFGKPTLTKSYKDQRFSDDERITMIAKFVDMPMVDECDRLLHLSYYFSVRGDVYLRKIGKSWIEKYPTETVTKVYLAYSYLRSRVDSSPLVHCTEDPKEALRIMQSVKGYEGTSVSNYIMGTAYKKLGNPKYKQFYKQLVSQSSAHPDWVSEAKKALTNDS